MTAVSWDSLPVEGGQAGYWRERALRAEEQLLTRSPANPEQVEVSRPIMLEMSAADDEHRKWERRWHALGQMYAPQRPCFVDRDGDWCLRDFLDYAGKACGFEGNIMDIAALGVSPR